MAFTDQHRQDLAEKGYTVVNGVLTDKECKQYIDQYRQWLTTNFLKGQFPLTAHSLIQRYTIGHLEPTWRVRLKARDVFAQLWGTERLLSSVDAVAIGRPPEDGEEEFHEDCSAGWLHLDQTARRPGFHCYQAAVYLETADSQDWTFEVVERSHCFFDEYHERDPEQQKRSFFRGHMKARDEHLDWMRDRGCVQKRVAAKRGSMVFWDSRLIHANARPIRGRPHPDRWRWVVFVCMAPAVWATKKALAIKRQAYVDLQMTTHWPCDDVGIMPTNIPSYAARELHPMDKLPEVAQSLEAKRLVGVAPYPEAKGEVLAKEMSLMQQRPRWHPLFPLDENGEERSRHVKEGAGGRTIKTLVTSVIVIAITVLLALLTMVLSTTVLLVSL